MYLGYLALLGQRVYLPLLFSSWAFSTSSCYNRFAVNEICIFLKFPFPQVFRHRLQDLRCVVCLLHISCRKAFKSESFALPSVSLFPPSTSFEELSICESPEAPLVFSRPGKSPFECNLFPLQCDRLVLSCKKSTHVCPPRIRDFRARVFS